MRLVQTDPVPDTTRTFARSTRDAFKDWTENAIGVEGPVVIRARAPLWLVWLRRFFLN